MKYKHTIPVTAIIENEGQFLFIKRSRFESNMAGKWVFPGGKVEKGEDAIEGLFRELEEETKLKFENEISFLSSYSFVRSEDESSSIGLVFLVKSKNRDVIFDNSVEDFKWINPEEIADYKFSYDDIKDFSKEKNVTIPGMEVHVRNAIIALKNNSFLSKECMSVSSYQKLKCSMSKEYFLKMLKSENINEFMKNNVYPSV